jgi:hypothetical protein
MGHKETEALDELRWRPADVTTTAAHPGRPEVQGTGPADGGHTHVPMDRSGHEWNSVPARWRSTRARRSLIP